ncbi:hypothetical protein [Pelagerythrobacter sp.]|uniref:hypothetical protein n=1 Tax=Pelagerythrobacter sp. TaxID=2800702 RepID=UPI0035AE18B3
MHYWIILPLPDYPGTHLLFGIVTKNRENRFADGRCIGGALEDHAGALLGSART